MSYIEALRSTPWVSTGRPYFIDDEHADQLVELLTRFGFNVIAVSAPEDGDVEQFLGALSNALGFSAPPARSWYSFNDYYGEIVRLDKGPIAVLVNDAGRFLQISPQHLSMVVHSLLSISEEMGPWSDLAVAVEYFFVGSWTPAEESQ